MNPRNESAVFDAAETLIEAMDGASSAKFTVNGPDEDAMAVLVMSSQSLSGLRRSQTQMPAEP